MKLDKMKIEILEDGTIKTTTDPISGANHSNAEQFLQFMAKMAGGETKRVKRTDAHHVHTHDHHHDHEHEHGPHTHEH